ncbi:MAG: lytic transglycosylase domain-containing protein [Spirochaetales bacterium]|nr:MAG: lytic transglycosylase domain-containing protein [Spirochaetales bacterium]
MIDNVSNIFERINEITSRIRDIQNLVSPRRKAENAPAAVAPQNFSGLLQEAMLAQDYSNFGIDGEDSDSVDMNASIKTDTLALFNLLKKQNETPDEINTNDIIDAASKTFGVDARVIRAVIQQESGFNPGAVSSKGAMGLMQLMPETADQLGVTDPFNVYQNIFGGTGYLRQMLDKYDNLQMALAAYNAGPKAVDFYGDIPPFEETRSYVENITAMLQAES